MMTYEEWVECTCDYNWWEWCYESFTTEMMDMWNVHVDDISFVGFYHQGSGAVFTGSVLDVAKFMEATGLILDNYAYTELAKVYAIGSSIDFKRSGRSSMLVYAEVESPGSLSYFMNDHDRKINSGMFAGRTIADVAALVDFYTVEKAITEWARHQCKELYDMLQDEYESLTSEEAYAQYVKDEGEQDDQVV